MQVAQVSPKAVWDNASASATISFASLPTPGSLVVVVINGWQGVGYDVTSVTDNQGNGSYTLVKSALGGAGNAARTVIAYKENIGSSSGTFTVTIDHTPASGNYGNASMAEVTGHDGGAHDVTASAVSSSTSTDAATGDSASPTAQAAEIVFAGMGLLTSDSTANITAATITGTLGTEMHVEQNGATHHCGEGSYRVVSAAGVQNASWAHDNTSQVGWTSLLVSFKASTAQSLTFPRWSSVRR